MDQEDRSLFESVSLPNLRKLDAKHGYGVGAIAAGAGTFYPSRSRRMVMVVLFGADAVMKMDGSRSRRSEPVLGENTQ